MSRAILFFILIVFTLAAGGTHKLVDNFNSASDEISSVQEIVEAGIKNCCDSESAEQDVEKPRCLGDNCLSAVSVLYTPEFRRVKIDIIPEQYLGYVDQYRFLRPPIA